MTKRGEVNDTSTFTAQEIDQWSSHKVMFEKLWPILEKPLEVIVELGAGVFSTEYLSKHCLKLYSYENNKEWADKISTDIIENHVKIRYWEEEKDVFTMQNAILDHPNANLVFIDHHGDRHNAAELCMIFGIDLIVIHDFSKEDAEKITIIDGYTLMVTNHFNPTALYTNDKEVIEKLK
jgi:hypothetical protein